MNWQPIETAPKDGTRILAFSITPTLDEDTGKTANVSAISVAYWFIGAWMEYPAAPRFVHERIFTHWMPIPEPPSGPQADQA